MYTITLFVWRVTRNKWLYWSVFKRGPKHKVRSPFFHKNLWFRSGTGNPPGRIAIEALRSSCSMVSNLTAGWILFCGYNNRLWRWLWCTDWNHSYTLVLLWVSLKVQSLTSEWSVHLRTAVCKIKGSFGVHYLIFSYIGLGIK